MTLPPSVHVLTLGCPKNEADSRAMGERLSHAGYVLVDDPDDADLLLVNTCSFIVDAAQESVDTVLAAVTTWKPLAPGRRVIVAGCLPSRYGRSLDSELPEVDAFVPVDAEDDIVRAALALAPVPEPAPNAAPAVGPFAYLNVCDGCDRACTFCTIPVIRGSFRSRSRDDILAEARRLVGAGAREIVLVGQDVSSWGRDRGETLPALVSALDRVDGLGWLRLMYLQPDGITERLLEAIASADTVCRYLDIPLQHAAPGVLRRMGRTGDADHFLRLLESIRRILPDVVVRTTLIAGFPGETEDEVDLLVTFLREAALDHVGVFAYSAEEGTPAARYDGHISASEARDRARRLREVADEVSVSRFRALSGSTLEVLVDGEEDGLATGRWYGQAPEVDGVVLLDRHVPPGTFVDATVEDAVGHDLIAMVLT